VQAKDRSIARFFGQIEVDDLALPHTVALDDLVMLVKEV
jgi:hypothetical protein